MIDGHEMALNAENLVTAIHEFHRRSEMTAKEDWTHPLERHADKWMNFGPLNESLNTIACHLKQAEAVYIHLEPGDGTRYEFFLIPMWNPRLRLRHLGLGDGSDWVWIAPVNLATGLPGNAVCFIGMDADAKIPPTFHELAEVYENEWTRLLIGHFIANLRVEFEKV